MDFLLRSPLNLFMRKSESNPFPGQLNLFNNSAKHTNARQAVWIAGKRTIKKISINATQASLKYLIYFISASLWLGSVQYTEWESPPAHHQPTNRQLIISLKMAIFHLKRIWFDWWQSKFMWINLHSISLSRSSALARYTCGRSPPCTGIRITHKLVCHYTHPRAQHMHIVVIERGECVVYISTYNWESLYTMINLNSTRCQRR